MPHSPDRPAADSSATVGAEIGFWVSQPAVISLQIVAAHDDGRSLHVTLDGVPLPVQEVLGPEPSGRQHLVRAGVGSLSISYLAQVRPGTATPLVTEAERLIMLRPSRFCPCDRLLAYGYSRLPGPEAGGIAQIQAITGYVSDHLQYVGGSSGPSDDAVDILLSGHGVCRDYAHLVVTLARAQGMAARFTSVYAPGLFPMDFHAVAEIDVDGIWHVVDATRLAPRTSLVRIATGRDAADTAFASTLSGTAELQHLTVTAVADGGLPMDDGNTPTVLM